MARLESVDTLRKSGYSLTVLRDGAEFDTFDEDMLELMRAGAESKMGRALDHIVGAIKRTLSRQYPVKVAAGSQFATASGTLRRRKSERRQPSPAGDPPGKISGDLAKSWQRKKPTWSKAKTVLTGRYFSKHPAAGRLEFGDDSQGKGFVLHLSRRAGREVGGGIKARPYQRPTLEREADRLSDILDGPE